MSPDLTRVVEAFRRHHPGQWRKGPPKALGVQARIDDSGADACVAVIEWAHRSTHQRAEFLRDRALLTGATLWRPSTFPGYLELATREGYHAPSVADLSPEVVDRLAHLDRVGRQPTDARRRVLDQRPDVAAAVEAVGGLREALTPAGRARLIDHWRHP